MNRDNAPKKFQIHPWSKEIENEVKTPLEWGNGGEIGVFDP
jgi:hypothetical protein